MSPDPRFIQKLLTNRLDFEKDHFLIDYNFTEKIPLQSWSLPPNESLKFDRTFNADLIGSVVTLKKSQESSKRCELDLPYPGLTLEIKNKLEGRPISGEMVLPYRRKFSGDKGKAVLELAVSSEKKYSRVFKVVLDFDRETAVNFDVKMRYAHKSIPQLKAGANSFGFQSINSDNADYNIDVELKLETLKNII